MSRSTQSLRRRDRRFFCEPLEQRLLLSAAPVDRELSAAVKHPDIVELGWHGETVRAAAGEWLVRLDDVAGPRDAQLKQAEGLLASLGNGAGDAPIVKRQLGLDGLFLVETFGVSDTDRMLAKLSRLPGFRYAEPNGVVELAATTPNDWRFSEQWSLHNTGQNGGTVDADIDAPEAWDITTGSSDIVVGVIDTGIDFTHPDLVNNIWTNPGEVAGDGIDNDGNGYVDDIHGWDFADHDNDPTDDHYHGTAVSSIIAGGNDAAGVAGLNWHAQIMPLRIITAMGLGRVADAVDALNYATMMKRDYGVNISLTNNSWGGSWTSQALHDALAANGDAGMLFIAAAGNGGADGLGDNNDALPFYPAGDDLPNVIAVGATQRNDEATTFSNFGPTSVDLHAPGQDVLLAVLYYGPFPDPSRYSLGGGTSFATPHVVGVASLAWSVAPTATAAEIKEALLAGVDPIPSLAGKSVSGGRLNARGTLDRLGLYVAAASPAGGLTVSAPPTEFAVRFSHDIDGASLAAADFTVNGVPATGLTFDPGVPREATFTFATSPVVSEGAQAMQFAAAAVSRLADSVPLHAYTGEFRYDAVATTIVTVDPPLGADLAGESPVLTFTFSEGVVVEDARLVLSQGHVATIDQPAPDRISFHVTGLNLEEQLHATLAGLREVFGNPMPPEVMSWHVDLPVLQFPELTRVAPHGSLVWSTSVEGSRSSTSTGGPYAIDVVAGQKLTFVATNHRGSHPAHFEVYDPDGLSIAGVTTESAAPVTIGPLIVVKSGAYTVSVIPAEPGAEGEAPFTIEAFVNAGLDVDALNANRDNNSLATAQSLAGAFIDLGSGASRGAVVGQADVNAGRLPHEREPNDTGAEANNASANFVEYFQGKTYHLAANGEWNFDGDEDWLQIGTVASGTILRISGQGELSAGAADTFSVQLYRGNGGAPQQVLAADLRVDGQAVPPIVVVASDTYFLRILGGSGVTGSYHLGVTQELAVGGRGPATTGNVTVETESNDTAATANAFGTSWRRTTDTARTTGFMTVDDTDIFEYNFLAGDRVSFGLPTDSPLEMRNLQLRLLGDGGFVREAHGSLESVLIPAEGTYRLEVSGGLVANYELAALLATAGAPPLPGPATDDWYSIDVTQGQPVTVALVGSTTSAATIALYDGDENLLATSTLGIGNLSAHISDFVPASTGSLYAVVRDQPGQDYQLLVTRGAGFDAEPNGAVGRTLTPQALSLSGTMLGSVGRGPAPLLNDVEPNDAGLSAAFAEQAAVANDIAGNFIPMGGRGYQAVVNGRLDVDPDSNGATAEFDFYRFVASPGDQLTATMEAIPLQSNNPDCHLTLFDRTGRMLAFNDDRGGGSFDSLFAFADFAYEGEYYLLARSYRQFTTGTYRLTLTLNTQQPLGITDDDYYQATLEEGQTYVISTMTPGDSQNDVDAAVELLNASGAVLASANAGATDGRNVRLPFTPSVSGEYRVRLYAESGHGEYVLRITPADPGDTDNDGDVDLDDLNAVRNHFGESSPGIPGDTSPFDSDVDLDDLNAVRNHFGEGMASIAETLTSAATIANRIAGGKTPSAPSIDLMAVDRVLEAAMWLRCQEAVKTAPSLPMRPKFARSR